MKKYKLLLISLLVSFLLSGCRSETTRLVGYWNDSGENDFILYEGGFGETRDFAFEWSVSDKKIKIDLGEGGIYLLDYKKEGVCLVMTYNGIEYRFVKAADQDYTFSDYDNNNLSYFLVDEDW